MSCVREGPFVRRESKSDTDSKSPNDGVGVGIDIGFGVRAAADRMFQDNSSSAVGCRVAAGRVVDAAVLVDDAAHRRLRS